MIKKILENFFGISVATIFIICGYLFLSLLMSLTMLSTSYFLFTMWPTPVRFMYVLLSMYVLFNGISDDFFKGGRGTR